jgi:hypothetical protein
VRLADVVDGGVRDPLVRVRGLGRRPVAPGLREPDVGFEPGDVVLAGAGLLPAGGFAPGGGAFLLARERLLGDGGELFGDAEFLDEGERGVAVFVRVGVFLLARIGERGGAGRAGGFRSERVATRILR